MAHICQKFILDPIGMFEFCIGPVEFCGAFGDAAFEIEVGALQVFEQLGIIDRDGSTALPELPKIPATQNRPSDRNDDRFPAHL